MKTFLLLLVCLNTILPQNLWHQSEWNFSGKVSALAVTPEGIIFAGTSGGIYKSLDNGAVWNKITSALIDLTINCLVINSEGHIYAGTSGGVYVSGDNGANWTKILSKTTLSIAFNSTGAIFAATYNGVSRSFDNGVTWADGLFRQTNALYVNLNDTIFAGCNFGYLWRSFDGRTWFYDINAQTDVNAIIADSSGNIYFGRYMTGVAVSNNDGSNFHSSGLTNNTVNCFALGPGNHVYAGTENGVYVSADTGLTWQQVNNGLTSLRIYSLAIDNDGNIYAGTGTGVYYSSNNGLNWSALNNGFNNAVINSFAADKKGNVYAATEGAVYFSDDNCLTFKPLGLNNVTINSLAVSDSEVFVGTKSGLYISSDKNNFIKCDIMWETERDIKFVSLDAFGNLFAAVDHNGIFLSTDRGLTWQNTGQTTGYFYNLISDNDGCTFAVLYSDIIRIRHDDFVWRNAGLLYQAKIAIDSRDNMFASNDNGFYYSRDHGTSWVKTGTLNNLQTLVSENDYIFAGTRNGVQLSSDNGTTWIPYNEGLTHLDIKSFAINTNGYLFAGTNGSGIFWSKNPEVTLPVELISFSGKNLNGTIILEWLTGSEKNNFGFEIERKFQEGFITVGFVKGNGTSSEINKYSFTDKPSGYGKYTYRLKQIDLDGSFSYSDNADITIDAEFEFYLGKNYPNPFNSSTVINYEVKRETFVSLKIFDMLGREVKSLVEERKAPGMYEVSFNAINLSSGFYIYRMSAGGFISTEKMLYLK